MARQRMVPIVISRDLMETIAHANRRAIELPDGAGWAVMVHDGLVYQAWVQAPTPLVIVPVEVCS